jgi:cyclophilin family peptidyl-prolyl cis-trans isomerase/HEAT repeat protein
MNTLMLLSALAYSAPDAATLKTIWKVEAGRGSPAPLMPLLKSEDPQTQARATLALARLRDPANLPKLEKLISSPNPGTAEAAAFGFALTPGGASFARSALKQDHPEAVRARLVQALGMQPEQANIKLLITALDEAAPIAQAAAVALGQHGMAEIKGSASPAVMEALAKPLRGRFLEPDVREAAAFAIARIAPKNLSAELTQEWTERADHDRSPTVRAFLVRGLAPSLNEAALGALLEAGASDPDRGVRISTARALGKYGSVLDEQALAKLVGDAAWDVQISAIEASGAVEGIDHKAMLTPFLEEGVPVDTQAAAIRALGKAGVNGPLRPFLAKDKPLALRVAVVSTLEDQKQLLRLLEKASEAPMRSAIAGRLAELEPGPDVARILIKNEDPALQAVGISILGESEDAALIGEVLDAMDSDDLDVLREGLKALDNLLALLPARTPAPAAAATVIEKALQHPSVSVRLAAQGPAARVGVSAAAPKAKVPDPADLESIVGARIVTDAGTLIVEFETELAPMTVMNFVTLAEADAFDDKNFHRVVADFVIQDGCPRGDGWGGPGYSIVDELSWLPYDEGTLGMALSGPDTGGSQWFITLAPQPHLNAGYTVFGQLVAGPSHAVHQGTIIRDVVIERI